MRRLLRGLESAERVRLLLSLTSIRGEGIIDALNDHLVTGHSIPFAALTRGEEDKNVRRALGVLNKVADTVERIKEIDWERYRNENHIQR